LGGSWDYQREFADVALKPYYEEEGITIYHGDCREILPQLEPVDLVLTDPPYGTGWVRGGGAVGEFSAKHERPEWDVFSMDWLALVKTKRLAIFTPVSRLEETCNAIPRRSVIYYRKTNVRPGGKDREPVVISPAISADDFTTYNGDCPLHPCQKPIELIAWLIELLSVEGDTLVDPFMGSGTTLRAAKDLGRKAIGIEIEEKYCEIAAKRLGQMVLPL
jgi:site-specific DNA-methyltransferase (adenine-specific)